jgi:hypothetical protein
MSETTKTFATGSITLRTGTEGPRHDPYGYEEWTWRRAARTVVLHEGLGCWVSFDDRRLSNADLVRASGKADESACRHWFEGITGVPMKTLERVIHRPRRCCARPRIDWVAGYPGESLAVCRSCGDVVGSSFSEAAVI